MDQKLLDYLQRILNARVYDVAIESPLELATKLSARIKDQMSTEPNENFGTLFACSIVRITGFALL